MWLFAMFDLPVLEPEERREYTRFRTALLNQGFHMMQYSVYARYCGSEEVANRYRKDIKALIPHDGEVRLMAVTDHQFAKMEIFRGKLTGKAEEPPEQLMFF